MSASRPNQLELSTGVTVFIGLCSLYMAYDSYLAAGEYIDESRCAAASKDFWRGSKHQVLQTVCNNYDDQRKSSNRNAASALAFCGLFSYGAVSAAGALATNTRISVPAASVGTAAAAITTYRLLS